MKELIFIIAIVGLLICGLWPFALVLILIYLSF